MNKEIIDKTIAALRHNHFEAFFAHNTAEASAIFFRDIFPGLQVETVSVSYTHLRAHETL